jgi:hypothetical protein
MARRDRPSIKNLIRLPKDAILDFLGRGLIGRRDEEEDEPLLELDIGAGLEFDGDQIKLKTGFGIKIDVDGICVDNDEDVPARNTITALTDLNLELDGCWLMVNKKYTVYEIRRNKGGMVKDLVSVGDFYDTDGVCIPVHDGYGGYGTMSLLSVRESSPGKPNFYKKAK